MALRSVILAFGLVCISWKSPQDQEKSAQRQHTETCPKSCKTCDEAIDKALKFLISQQKEEEGWPNTGKAAKYGKFDFSLYTTVICGLALIADGALTKDGRNKAEFQRATKSVIRYLEDILKTINDKAKYYLENHVKFDQMPATAIFLAHVYNKEKTNDLKELLEKILPVWEKQQRKDGGWHYRPSYAGSTYMTNEIAVTLRLFELVGIEVDNKFYDGINKFYPKVLAKDGSFDYFIKSMKTNAKGRTAASIWPLELLGFAESEIYTKVKEYADKNIDSIDNGHHGPSFHVLWGGLSCFYQSDKTAWEKFWKFYRDFILDGQKEDGSIMVKARKGTFFPVDGVDSLKFATPVYTTAHYLVVLQLAKGHLLFDKLKKQVKTQ